MIKAYYLEGIRNCRADFLSRHTPSDHSYSLRQDIFDEIRHSLSFKLIIDCFASRLNNKLLSFISRHSVLYSSGIDRSQLDGKIIYICFLPFRLYTEIWQNSFRTKLVMVCLFAHSGRLSHGFQRY